MNYFGNPFKFNQYHTTVLAVSLFVDLSLARSLCLSASGSWLPDSLDSFQFPFPHSQLRYSRDPLNESLVLPFHLQVLTP